MSSPPPTAGGDRQGRSPPTGSRGTWHPAREWLEEDETREDDEDMDFEPDSDVSDLPDQSAEEDEDEHPEDDDEGLYVDPFGITMLSLRYLLLLRYWG